MPGLSDRPQLKVPPANGTDHPASHPVSVSFYKKSLPSGLSSALSNNMAHKSNGTTTLNEHGPSSGKIDDDTPSYWVEHLATFAIGKQFGLEWPSDGIRKLKQMERNSAIWAQPMVLRLKPNVVSVEDENGELVEQFALELVADPTAHLSIEPRDVYNNILLFVVREDRRVEQQRQSNTPTEMHIFQCNRVSADDVVQDMTAFLTGRFQRVPAGRRDTGFQVISASFLDGRVQSSSIASGLPGGGVESRPMVIHDDTSLSSDSSEYFERDVNTLNRCFDDIERFVARIQSAALAHRELESRRQKRFRGGAKKPQSRRDQGLLHNRAQLPAEAEFVDVLHKFKLSFNLLAKLKNHIHEPNAPELLHFLFTPLTVILDACHWGLGRNVAFQVISPLLARETRDLMCNCLTSRESDVWMALGDSWRTIPEDWPGPLPPPYRPVFLDGFAPYGSPVFNPEPSQRMGGPSVENLTMDVDRLALERERMDFEQEKLLEKKRRLQQEERTLRHERQRLEMEKMMVDEEHERSAVPTSPSVRRTTSSQPTMSSDRRRSSPHSSRHQAHFADEFRRAAIKSVRAVFDRTAQNNKELTVAKGDTLCVLDDARNWWQCRNVHGKVGYVPHTILSLVVDEDRTAQDQPSSTSVSPRLGMMGDDVPDYLKQRQGRRGEFRYF